MLVSVIYSQKILSTNELKEFSNAQNKNSFLAKRFASKEALSKSIGIGLYRQGLSPSIIDIKKDHLVNQIFKQRIEIDIKKIFY